MTEPIKVILESESPGIQALVVIWADAKDANSAAERMTDIVMSFVGVDKVSVDGCIICRAWKENDRRAKNECDCEKKTKCRQDVKVYLLRRLVG
jgi:hypothetical protein